MAVSPSIKWKERLAKGEVKRSEYIPRINTHADFMKEHKKMFEEACERGGVKPTKRQASKFRRGYGAAYANRHAVTP